jgi:hypothetical protein
MADVDSIDTPAATLGLVDFCILTPEADNDPVPTIDLIYGLNGICHALAERLVAMPCDEPLSRMERDLLAGLALAAQNHATALQDRMGVASCSTEDTVRAALIAEREGRQKAQAALPA